MHLCMTYKYQCTYICTIIPKQKQENLSLRVYINLQNNLEKNPLTGFPNHWISYHTPPLRLLNIQEIFAPSNEPLTNYHYSDINPDG